MQFFTAFGVILCVALHLKLGYTDVVNEPDSQVLNQEVQPGTESLLQVLPEYSDDGSRQEPQPQPSTESILQPLPGCSGKGSSESGSFEPSVDEDKFEPTSSHEMSLIEPATQSLNEEEQADTESPNTNTEELTYPTSFIDENAENTTSDRDSFNGDFLDLGDGELSDPWPANDEDILVFTDADFPGGDVKPSENITFNSLGKRILAFEKFILQNKMTIN